VHGLSPVWQKVVEITPPFPVQGNNILKETIDQLMVKTNLFLHGMF